MRSAFAKLFGSLLLICHLAAPAAPVQWDWSYSDVAGNAGAGTLSTGDLSGGSYLITSISGLWNGNAITGLLPALSCCYPPNNDNLLLDAVVQLDLGGVAFSVAGDTNKNIFGFGGAYQVIDPGQNIGPVGRFLATMDNAIPEPATSALVVGALALLGLSRRRTAG